LKAFPFLKIYFLGNLSHSDLILNALFFFYSPDSRYKYQEDQGWHDRQHREKAGAQGKWTK
jgi:hypothetical protein